MFRGFTNEAFNVLGQADGWNGIFLLRVPGSSFCGVGILIPHVPDICVIVVAFQSDQYLVRCIASLAEPGVQCILVHNSPSSEELDSQLHRLHPDLTIVGFSNNLGFVGGNNLGFEKCSSPSAEIIGMVNPDAWLEAGWSSVLRFSFFKFARYGVLAPVQLTYEIGEVLADWTRKTFNVDSLRAVLSRGSLLDCDWVEGSALFIRRHLLDNGPLLHPLYDMYFEEVDLCRWVRRRGWMVGVVTSFRFHHAVGGSFGSAESPRRRFRKDLGQVLYVACDPNRSLVGNISAVLRLWARHLWEWLLFRYPSGGLLLVSSFFMLVRKMPQILKKWSCERRVLPCP